MLQQHIMKRVLELLVDMLTTNVFNVTAASQRHGTLPTVNLRRPDPLHVGAAIRKPTLTTTGCARKHCNLEAVPSPRLGLARAACKMLGFGPNVQRCCGSALKMHRVQRLEAIYESGKYSNVENIELQHFSNIEVVGLLKY